MSKKKILDRNVPGKLFKPTFRRAGRQSSAYLKKPQEKVYKLKERFSDTNLESSSSYRYGDKKFLASTQQARIDYSRFENHTFFHSAVANTNESFDRIVNFYPFAGTQKDFEVYEDELTGFEKYVLDSFPKNVGYLNFSGSEKSESLTAGTYLQIVDRSGAQIPSLSPSRSSKKVLDPLGSPLTIEMFLKLPAKINDNQIIVQKRNSLANNFTLALSQSSNTSHADLMFGITSGSNYTFVSASINKGDFRHVVASYDPLGDKKAKLYIDNLVVSSSTETVFNSIDTSGADMFIGTGAAARINNHIFTPRQGLSGSIDAFKIFHKSISHEEARQKKFNTTYKQEGLKLHYNFNEPFGSHSGNNIVLDSSGNSLHTQITNYLDYNRTTGSDVPVKNENVNRCPILFPTHEKVLLLNTALLTTGSEYDKVNPNMITKLIPPHYFDESNNSENFESNLGNLGQAFNLNSSNTPGTNENELGAASVLTKFLLTWAKFFDEIKIMLDTVSNYGSIDYDEYENVPDPFLKQRGTSLNISLPSLFRGSNLSQLIEGVNLDANYANSKLSLTEIQNLVWRRILADSANMKLTKGTLDSIRSVFRSAGIEPENILTFREYGGAREKTLNSSREKKRDIISFLNFSGSLENSMSSKDFQGYSTGDVPRIKSSYLTASRVEPGVPHIRGDYVQKNNDFPNGISNNISDGLLTSGSFTYEAFYDWESGEPAKPESLIRIHTTGSGVLENKEAVAINLVGQSGSLDLFVRDAGVVGENVKRIQLKGVNIFDKDVWYVSFGRSMPHDLTDAASNRQEYFIRAAKQHAGEIIETHQTSSHYLIATGSVLTTASDIQNASGSFLVIGKQVFSGSSSAYNKFLNDNSTGKVNSLAHSSSFSGLVSNIRFWSKNTSQTEWSERAKNLASVGVDKPKDNYNFITNTSGSFERLRLHTFGKQATTDTDASGKITFFDFSQNNNHFAGAGFEKSKTVFKPLRVDYEILSDKFDLNYAKTKIRVRSFQNAEYIGDSNYASTAPMYEVPPAEEVTDDNRFSIDMSVMKGLNENILGVFSDFSPIDDALGAPNLVFSDSYPDLRHMRYVYFHNLLEKIDLSKYRTLFKWIDNAFTDIVFGLVPKSTNFLGINFIYESHVLERNRMKYLFDEIYLKSLPRDASRGNLLLSQFVGTIKKY